MILERKKFQTIIINRENESNDNCKLTIKNKEIKSKPSVTLLSIEIENQWKYLSLICKILNTTNDWFSSQCLGEKILLSTQIQINGQLLLSTQPKLGANLNKRKRRDFAIRVYTIFQIFYEKFIAWHFLFFNK